MQSLPVWPIDNQGIKAALTAENNQVFWALHIENPELGEAATLEHFFMRDWLDHPFQTEVSVEEATEWTYEQ